MDGIDEQTRKLQTEITETRALLHQGDTESMSRQELKDDIERKEKQLAELHKMEAATELSLPRRSERPSVLTEKMLAYQKDELNKKDKKLLSLYEQWKGLIRTSRESLETDLSEHKLCAMACDIERGLNNMMKVYIEIREHTVPSPDTRRKMDSCEAGTKDIMKILNERITAIDGDFEADRERRRLHQLLSHQYAHSIYGTASQSSVGKQSDTSSIAAKRIDAAAELAAKEAEYKIVQEEIKQKEKLKDIEHELERLMAEK